MNCRRGVAQLVEHRSPKPGVAGSIPVSPAIILLASKSQSAKTWRFCYYSALSSQLFPCGVVEWAAVPCLPLDSVACSLSQFQHKQVIPFETRPQDKAVLGSPSKAKAAIEPRIS